MSAPPHIALQKSIYVRAWIPFAGFLPILLLLLFRQPVLMIRNLALGFFLCWCAGQVGQILFKVKWRPEEGTFFLSAALLIALLPADIRPGVLVFVVFTSLFLGIVCWGGQAFYPVHPTVLGFCLFQYCRPKTALLESWAFSFWQPAGDFWNYLMVALILVSGIVLLVQKIISWKIPVVYLGVLAVLSFGMKLYSTFSLSAILLAAFYLAGDSVSTAVSIRGKMIQAALAALGTVVFDLLEVRAAWAFSLLWVHFLTPWLDQWILPSGISNEI